MYFSIIIPVYNRPDEVNELLESLQKSTYKEEFEIVIVEDGSTISSEEVVAKFSDKLNINYFFKENSGPGDSRNYGMLKAKGDYFIIFDSDCIIPENYLQEVAIELNSSYVDCYGGPDAALDSFSNIQKAINFAMTSTITTGGIRGGSEKISKFQPRSFNMGISKKAFLESKGFGNIHPGEDPDLSIRLWKLGYETRLFTNAFVYHKRRIDWEKFSLQVSKFGKARPILNSWYPEYSKITFWFPTFFVIGLIASFVLIFALFDWPLKLYFLYFLTICILSSVQNKSLLIGLLTVVAVWKQFFGYGFGFMTSYFKIHFLKQQPQIAFPELFFKVKTTSDNFNQPKIIIEKEEKKVKSKKVEIEEITPTEEKKPKIIGLTGGIGSGKTAVANYIQSKGIPVYISDLEAKKVMELPEVITEIESNFGESVVTENRTLDREKLASIVFNDQDKLKLLNSIVHPAVKRNFERWVVKHKNYSYLVKEAAVLFESGSYKDCAAVITVCAPVETRIERVIQRDKTTREKVQQRINNQLTDGQRIEKSQYVINNEDFEQTKIQIDDLLNLLKNIQ
jgi:dephospho-CoA kinase